MWFTAHMAAIPELTPRTGPARGASGAVVQPITRAAQRPCARPGCLSPASATLAFRYDTQQAWIGPLAPNRTPEGYDLCVLHAGRTRPPRGWDLVDRRSEEERQPPTATVPENLGGDQTVAVLAAVLREVRTAETPAAEDRLPSSPTDGGGREARGVAGLEDEASPVLEPPPTSPPPVADSDSMGAHGDVATGGVAPGDEHPGSSSVDGLASDEQATRGRVRARPGRRRRRTAARTTGDLREPATSW